MESVEPIPLSTLYNPTAVIVAVFISLAFYLFSFFVQYWVLKRAVRVGNEEAFKNRTK
jgi:hypothetical protein